MAVATVALAAPAPLTASTTTLVIPDTPQSSRKSWRRLVTAIDPTAPAGARQLSGPWLEPGMAYSLPLGAVVVLCDRYRDQWHITMATAETGELTTVKEWHLKSPMGARPTGYIARRLPVGAAAMTAVLREEKSNRYAGRCALCRRDVAAEAGRLVKEGGRQLPAHQPGMCPPPPPPPEVVTPNRRGEPCRWCGHWVEPGTGVALLLPEPDPGTGARYRAAHQAELGDCPPARPGPTNRVPGWCRSCGVLVHEGEGYWDPTARAALLHAGPCPSSSLTGPSWRVRRPRHEPAFEVGQIRRVRVDLRRGGEPIPPQTPGFRVLGEEYIELVALVVETLWRGRRQWARVCPATPTEAAEEVAADAVAALEARPDAGSFMAGWQAERRGRVVPWLAEVTGRDPDFDYRRVFRRPKRDHRHASARGMRGVWFHWDLEPGRVFEARWPRTGRKTQRAFLRTTPEGDVQEISREEVEAWLNHAPAWAAS